MDWTRAIDGYCERTGPEYWAEPINAVTNAAFLIAAIILWRRSAGLPLARVLCGILAAIGVGSYLFHTHAQPWAMLMDVSPIAAFILVYIFAMNLHVLRWPMWAALLGTLAFIPYAMATGWVFVRLPFFEISSFYWPVALLIAIYAVLLWKREPVTGRGLAIGAAILCLSLTARSVDEPLCEVLPMGTHFLWHILNGIMLGWMIAVYGTHRRLALEGGDARR